MARQREREAKGSPRGVASTPLAAGHRWRKCCHGRQCRIPPFAVSDERGALSPASERVRVLAGGRAKRCPHSELTRRGGGAPRSCSPRRTVAGELKPDMLQRLEAIRSRRPGTLNQELWGRRDAALRE